MNVAFKNQLGIGKNGSCLVLLRMDRCIQSENVPSRYLFEKFPVNTMTNIFMEKSIEYQHYGVEHNQTFKSYSFLCINCCQQKGPGSLNSHSFRTAGLLSRQGKNSRK